MDSLGLGSLFGQFRAPKQDINRRVLQNMTSGIVLVLRLRTKL